MSVVTDRVHIAVLTRFLSKWDARGAPKTGAYYELKSLLSRLNERSKEADTK